MIADMMSQGPVHVPACDMKDGAVSQNITKVNTGAQADVHTNVGAAGPFLGKHVYFVGIGGSGMSGLAQMYAERGAVVSGSDKEPSDVTLGMTGKGINITYTQQEGVLPDVCDGVVASAAITAEHPELVAARGRGIEVTFYAQALGALMRGSTGIAVAGTHGKTTTTAMLGVALTDAGLDPSVIVGATVAQLAGGAIEHNISNAPVHNMPRRALGYRVGNVSIPAGPLAGAPGLLVAEACEYNRSFHRLAPTMACINNIEADHLDVYGTLDNVVESFRHFAAMLPPASAGGKLLIHHENAHRREVTSGLTCAVETIGFHPGADWNISYDAAMRGVTVSRGGEVVGSWCNALSGAHNASNAATAFVLGVWSGADPAKLSESLSRFRGADRRMQFLGERPVSGGSVRVYDDYAHHPTEVEVTLRAFRESLVPAGGPGRLIVVFQPHQHSRTRHLLTEFAASFSEADCVLVPHIYFVRDTEDERTKVTAGDLVDKLRERGVQAFHLYPFDAIVTHLGATARAGDVVVTMGAGDVWKVAEGYLRG